MNEAERAFLFELLNTPSPSGFEAGGQKVWLDYVRSFADEAASDTYGTAWAIRAGTGAQRLMIEAHADEIGFMIRQITDEGFLRVSRIGGIDRVNSRGKKVTILGDKGTVPGVVGNTAIHIRDRNEKVPEIHDLYIDVGCANKDEVSELGLRVGHPMVFTDSTEEIFSGRLTGRALDNRIGGYIIAQVIKRLTESDPKPASVIAVNSVQEEIGGHGAKMATYRLEPTVAICLDVTHATDTPGIEKSKHGEVKLGGGPSVTHGKANHPEVIRRLLQVAEENEIPIQHEAISMFTGTDTDDIFRSRSGVPSALISLPMRYMHSTVETVELVDVERCIDLLFAFACSIQDEDEFKIQL